MLDEAECKDNTLSTAANGDKEAEFHPVAIGAVSRVEEKYIIVAAMSPVAACLIYLCAHQAELGECPDGSGARSNQSYTSTNNLLRCRVASTVAL